MINGNTSGIKEYTLKRMESLLDIRLMPGEFASIELLSELAGFTAELEREISVFISRSGNILDVSVGENDRVTLPYIRKRRGTLGLSGVRCIHTHPSGNSHLSDVDRGTLLSSRLDAMAALGVRDGKATSICIGMIGESLTETVEYGPFPVYRIPNAALAEEVSRKTALVAKLVKLNETDEKKERVMLIGINTTEESMTELRLLVETAGGEVVSSDIQMRQRDKSTYIGRGKAKDIALAASALDADTAVINDELTPVEERNLEDILGLKVVDRTTLILDIFAGRAKSREGKLQVELAQLRYNLPRLMGEGTSLSRLGGGIGTRGPGEKKIETDRRRIRRRIYELGKEIDDLKKDRDLRRESREKNRMKTVALIGYTNAGKSTLLNLLSDAGVYADDKLFATLDTVTRRIALPSGNVVLITDTVGFISKLPHDLVSAFRSTLEEAKYADLLLNVTDVSNPESDMHTAVVKEALRDLEASDKPMITVFNKSDRLGNIPKDPPGTVHVSALTGYGIETLLSLIDEKLRPSMKHISVKLRYSEGARLARIQSVAEQADIRYTEDAIILSALVPSDFEA